MCVCVYLCVWVYLLFQPVVSLLKHDILSGYVTSVLACFLDVPCDLLPVILNNWKFYWEQLIHLHDLAIAVMVITLIFKLTWISVWMFWLSKLFLTVYFTCKIKKGRLENLIIKAQMKMLWEFSIPMHPQVSGFFLFPLSLSCMIWIFLWAQHFPVDIWSRVNCTWYMLLIFFFLLQTLCPWCKYYLTYGLVT